MSYPDDHGSDGLAEPLSACCSFCLKRPSDECTLIEEPERGEVGAAYLCQDCVELCAEIFENQKRKTSDSESEDRPGSNQRGDSRNAQGKD